MTHIQKTDSGSLFQEGIDLGKSTELASLQKFDANADGRLTAGELLRGLLHALDRWDDAAVPTSPAPDKGAVQASASERILSDARVMQASPETSQSLAKASAYRSTNPAITGTYEGRPKCNLFVGDVLAKSGFQVPTYDLTRDGKVVGKHYKEVEAWPRETAYFDKVSDLSQVKPGDVLVIDWPRHGSGGGAHVEIITNVRAKDGMPVAIETVGARTAGLVEDDKYGAKLLAARDRGDHFETSAGATSFYILRPKREELVATRDLDPRPMLRA
jgi:hypothetical protein